MRWFGMPILEALMDAVLPFRAMACNNGWAIVRDPDGDLLAFASVAARISR